MAEDRRMDSRGLLYFFRRSSHFSLIPFTFPCYDTYIINESGDHRMAQETFERYEKKYLLDDAQFQALLGEMKPYLKRDTFGKYTISNIYYDTPDDALIRTSLQKPYYKEKLRLRSYGHAEAEDPVFLEIKKKCDGIVYKRRAKLRLSEARNYLERGIRPQENSQIMRELDWFLQRYTLEPKVFLAYDREAYIGREDDGLRVTFDTAIRCRQSLLTLSAGTGGRLLLPGGEVLMEVKIPGVMPYPIAQLFSKYKVYPVSFSKYGTYYQKKLSEEAMGGYRYA